VPGGTRETDDQRARRVLAQRARALAVPPASPPGESLDLVAFEAGPERFAIPVGAVLRVERVTALARVPGAAPEVIGVLSVDGRPCALVDAPALLGAARATAPRRWAIVLGERSPEVALAADTVDLLRVLRVELSAAGPPRLGITADARVVLDGAAVTGGATPPSAGGDRP
jgi:chemotaxis signal transduction protein